MSRTKWMRLGVKDPADIVRWAGAQNIRRLDDFRHRIIGGREFVSFRMVPRYAIEIGTGDIIVVAHVVPGARQLLAAALAAFCRRAVRQVSATITALKSPGMAPAPAHSAELYQFAALRGSSPARRWQ
jgi:hypothetical protein